MPPGFTLSSSGGLPVTIWSSAGRRAAGRRSRAVVATAASVLAAAALAAPAGASLTPGPVDPFSGFPSSYTDDLGTSLELCQDVSGFCVEAPRPNPNQPISVPDNFTPDEEGFWWLADATVPGAGRGLARFAKEAAFDTPGINQGHQVQFTRIRFRFDGLVAGATYRVTHPFGVDEITADPDPQGGGLINFTEDIGCLAAPCGAFPALSSERISSFLTWDPTVLPAAPSGYVGNGVTPHAVIGSPLGTNFVRLERLIPQTAPQAPVAAMVGETNQFTVQGKLAGPPPAPAPHLGLNTASLDFGTRQVGDPSAAKTVTVSNHGTADLVIRGVAVAGTDAADFAAANDTCSGRTLAPAASCSVDVRFAPAHAGDLSASLRIDDTAANAPHNVALSGIGVGASGAAPSGSAAGTGASSPGATNTVTIVQAIPLVQVAGAVARPLAVTSLALSQRISIARLRARGLRITMRLPAGTGVVRFAIYRARKGKATGRALAIGYRVPARAGAYRLVLRDRALLRKLKRGRYVLQVRPGRSRSDLGATSTVGFTVTR